MANAGNQKIWFITGTSRGIGLELTKQLLRSPENTVVAACRNPANAEALNGLKTAEETKGKLHVVALDVKDAESSKKSAAEVTALLGDKGVDYLINNAGVMLSYPENAFEFDLATLQETLLVNVGGPALTAQAFLPLVEKSAKKTIVNISSSVGSIGDDSFGPLSLSYAISKAALNMLTYKQRKIRPDLTVVSVCPGWLQTDLGGPNAIYTAEQGVEGVIKVVTGLTHADSGRFINFQGKQVPW